MSPRRAGLLAAVLAVPALARAAPARAETRRLAVVVGNNAGSGARPALRYAEADAEKVGRLLVELGGVAAADLRLLRGESIGAVRAALAETGERARRLAEGLGTRVVVLFYFSGHSDGTSLELQQGLLPFAEVRGWLADTRAAVRLAILDSCRSGGLLALKGGVLGPTFDVRLADSLASTGEALITSSAASEWALESSEIRASFFSHHLISGLRGAADVSGDGLVTLSEAYQYAFARTVNATANTTVGPQHPGYDYRLAGRGDLVLTQIRSPSAVLQLPPGFDRLLVVDARRQEVVAEIGASGARRLATQPGRYDLRGWHGGRLFAGRVTVAANGDRVVTAGELVETRALAPASKGATADLAGTVDRPDGPGRSWRALAGLGLVGASSDATTPLLLGRLAVRSPQRWVAALVGGSWRQRAFRESQVQLRFGRHRAWGRSLRLVAGGELGAGIILQNTDRGRWLWTTAASAAPMLALEWALGRSLDLVLAADLPLTVLRLDRKVAARVSPGVLLGAWF
jgi:hypothetical protein